MDHAVDLPSQHHLLFSPHPGTVHGFLDELTACTYTHTCCNPPAGPSSAATTHTHTCLHTHLQVLASGETTAVEEGDPAVPAAAAAGKPRRPLGNREAVRKYREKKKAHAAFLEEEVKKLRAANQQLLKRLQGYAELEAEVVRLRGLLADEIGALPEFQLNKHCISGSVKCFGTDDNAELAAPEVSSGPALVDLEVGESGGSISRDPGNNNPDVDPFVHDVAIASLVK